MCVWKMWICYCRFDGSNMGGYNKKTRINNYIKGININKMSTENPQQTQPGPAKPITANF